MGAGHRVVRFGAPGSCPAPHHQPHHQKTQHFSPGWRNHVIGWAWPPGHWRQWQEPQLPPSLCSLYVRRDKTPAGMCEQEPGRLLWTHSSGLHLRPGQGLSHEHRERPRILRPCSAEWPGLGSGQWCNLLHQNSKFAGDEARPFQLEGLRSCALCASWCVKGRAPSRWTSPRRLTMAATARDTALRTPQTLPSLAATPRCKLQLNKH